MGSGFLRQFFFPSLTGKFAVRVLLVVLGSYLIFGYLLIPLRIQGKSMEPTYQDGSFAFCWRPAFLLSPPRRFDVVAVRYAGHHVMLLKRILALAGETIEFRRGDLYVNGALIPEPYVKNHSSWDLPPRRVAQGKVYIVGDNRNTVMERHRFGQVSMNRIVGGVIL